MFEMYKHKNPKEEGQNTNHPDWILLQERMGFSLNPEYLKHMYISLRQEASNDFNVLKFSKQVT